MANKYPLSKYRQRLIDDTKEYKVKPQFLFFAQRGHLQSMIDMDKLDGPYRTAALRAYKRITGSRGTIVTISVKDPQYQW